jgi:hypothetical protein
MRAFLVQEAREAVRRRDGMDACGRSIWFLGDREDPWVRAILETVSDLPGLRPVHCPGELSEQSIWDSAEVDLVIVHRNHLSNDDMLCIERLRSARKGVEQPRVIVCFSPFVRYAELERCAQSVDLVIPEATARETLRERLSVLLGEAGKVVPQDPPEPTNLIVASTDPELREVLAAVGRQEDFRAILRADLDGFTSDEQPLVTVWDVPVLSADWPQVIQRQSHFGPLVALIGFADRASVTLALSAGAMACLDVPFDLEDLRQVLDRARLMGRTATPGATVNRIEAGHTLPPEPAVGSRRRTSRGGRDPALQLE